MLSEIGSLASIFSLFFNKKDKEEKLRGYLHDLDKLDKKFLLINNFRYEQITIILKYIDNNFTIFEPRNNFLIWCNKKIEKKWGYSKVLLSQIDEKIAQIITKTFNEEVMNEYLNNLVKSTVVIYNHNELNKNLKELNLMDYLNNSNYKKETFKKLDDNLDFPISKCEEVFEFAKIINSRYCFEFKDVLLFLLIIKNKYKTEF